MTENEIAWCAGLFDGDGCISLYKKESRYILNVNVTITHLEGLQRFVDIINVGKITLSQNAKGKRKAVHAWQLSGFEKSINFLKLVQPYLKCKNKDVETILDFYDKFVNIKFTNLEAREVLYNNTKEKLNYFRSKEYLLSQFNNFQPIETGFCKTKAKNVKKGRKLIVCGVCKKEGYFGSERKFCSKECSYKSKITISDELSKKILLEYKPYSKKGSLLFLSKKYDLEYKCLKRAFERLLNPPQPSEVKIDVISIDNQKIDTASELDICWAAGLFDAEGTITICKTSKILTYNLVLSLQMTNVETVMKFRDIVGFGSVRFYDDNRKEYYKKMAHWSCQGFNRIKEFIAVFESHLVLKKLEAATMKNFLELVENSIEKPYEEILKLKDQFYLELKRLKSLEYYKEKFSLDTTVAS